jgi:hypothetical protein
MLEISGLVMMQVGTPRNRCQKEAPLKHGILMTYKHLEHFTNCLQNNRSKDPTTNLLVGGEL